MNVLLLCRYGMRGASSRVRMLQFLPGLRDAGIDVTPAPLIGDALLAARYADGRYPAPALAAAYLSRLATLTRARRFDLLWIEYELFPWIPAILEVLLDWSGIPYVVEYDDAVFHRYDRHPRPLVRTLLGRKIDRVMRHARLVIAGNRYLGDRAQASGARRCVQLPSVVDTAIYTPAPSRHAGVPVIGWIGSPTTARYLAPIEPALAPVVERGLARVVVVGAVPRWTLPVETRPWDPAREVADVQGFDIGIMPLADGPWERGKCGYKLVQYMACGLATVASPVGANLQILRDGVDGILADGVPDWRAAVERLVADPALRASCGRAGRAHVEESYSLQRVLPRLAAALSDAASRIGRP